MVVVMLVRRPGRNGGALTTVVMFTILMPKMAVVSQWFVGITSYNNRGNAPSAPGDW